MTSQKLFNQLCALLDADQEFLEILLPYLETLLAVGVDLNYLPLQQAIEGHITHLETACQCLLSYAGWLAQQGERFGSETHATSCFLKALIEHWQPFSNWATYIDAAAQARYISPYEQARRLIHAINAQHPDVRCDPSQLEALSDAEIAALIPQLETLKTQTQT